MIDVVRLLNRYSFLMTTALAMGVAWLLGSRFGGLWPTVAVAVAGLVLALAQRKLRGGASDAAAWEALASDAGDAEPRLLFIYSDTCGASLAAQPVVEALERELAGRPPVIRLNVADQAGAEAQARFAVEKVPAVIVLDRSGVERYRSEARLPNRTAILDAVTRL